jgi:hypothetical protein
MPKPLKYGGVVAEESECVIRLDKQDGVAHVWSSWPEWSRKFARRYGDPSRYQEWDGFVYSAFWTVPLAAISIRSVVKRPRNGIPKSILPSVAPRKSPLLEKRPPTPGPDT